MPSKRKQIPCPACDTPVLVVRGDRWSAESEALDPEPSAEGGQYDTMLNGDMSYISGAGQRIAALVGYVPLYRRHQWSCAQGMRVPMTRALPGIGGYSHRAVVKDGQA